MKTLLFLTLSLAIPALAATSLLAQAEPSGSPVVMLVNGVPLYEVEVRQIHDNLKIMLARQGREVEAQELQNVALDQGVDMKLLVQEATRRGIETDEAKIDTILQAIEKDAGGAEALAAGLSQNGLKTSDLRRGVAEKESIRILMEREIEPSVVVSDEDLETFYKANTDRFVAPETVHARHILYSIEGSTDEEAKTEARNLAAAAHERAIAGEDFAELAKELSQGPSAESGGDLGFISAEQMVQPFAEAAFALEIGAISGVVETPFGFHVIKVEEKRAGGMRSLEEVTEPLRAMLEQSKLSETVEALLTELRDKATILPAAPPQPEAGS